MYIGIDQVAGLDLEAELEKPRQQIRNMVAMPVNINFVQKAFFDTDKVVKEPWKYKERVLTESDKGALAELGIMPTPVRSIPNVAKYDRVVMLVLESVHRDYMGANLWMPIFTGINGILLALVPIIAHLRGAKNEADLPKAVFNGIFLAIVIGLTVIGSGYLFLNRIFDLMSLTPIVRSIAVDYLQAISLGIIPLFITTILRSFVDTMGFTHMTMKK